jgi:hypothetical protein
MVSVSDRSQIWWGELRAGRLAEACTAMRVAIGC